ncbi:hypothetical protein SPRG_10665 [Saprolegnia parasitica CBS 223.65]|uniref:Major facilitator superfamily (MFS) profile domain-containing protein n=1 Tax=Saprolegnia parasitica (strain CBS 223.65) TaxID=695850 RepID=A0A067C0A2_SAPPC|nr:hypothetical protein SPRG_10665 [Saprolegnia parasitica CBS 223.65]KDO23968.1 hypothetical protein SPRG_10665 [Saprolegnia parasitica CBS 223.65]|eukprot:XP_012205289.1 hypothetical protein SPRG_10665 [Saprolegnia parasitica CBS 223.65]
MLYATAETRTWKFLKLIALKENVTGLNFVAFVLASGLAICMYVFLSSTQGFVLGDILQVPVTKIGDISGNLTLFDECVSLIMVYVWGVYSDRIGRHGIYGLGFVLIGAGLLAYPYATSYNSDLIAYRALYALGAAATSSMLTAVLADYAAESDRGKISGLVGLMSGVGALLAVFVFLPLPTKFASVVDGLRISYAIVGGVSIAFGFFLLYALRPKSTNKDSALLTHDHETTGLEQSKGDDRPPTFLEGFKAGVAAASDGKVLLGYMGSFLARGDTIIITIFLPLWVYKYYIENKLCDATDVNAPDIKDDCRKAYVTASIVGGVVQTAALVAAPLFGYIGDRLYRPLVVLLSTIIGFVGYFWMYASTDPTSPIMFAVAIVVGVGEMGIIVSSLSLVTSKAIPAQLRGSVSGAYSFCGTIGILITSKLGGYLFDHWTSTAPFFIMAVGNVVCALVAICVMYKDVAKARVSTSGERIPLLRSLREMQLNQDELRLLHQQ